MYKDIINSHLFPFIQTHDFQTCVADYGQHTFIMMAHPNFTLDKAIAYASEYGHLDTVHDLVSLGADIRSGQDYALREASSNGHLEVVQFLVSFGADVCAHDSEALRWASRNGHLNVVRFLVALGADVHAWNECAVKWASAGGHLEVVRFLVSAGADVCVDTMRLACFNGHTHVKNYLATLV